MMPRRSRLPPFAGGLAGAGGLAASAAGVCSVMAAPGWGRRVAIGVRSVCRAERRAITDIPPAAAEGAEQCGGIREALRVGLYLRERGVLVLLLGGQNLQLGVLAGRIFLGGKVLVGTSSFKRA